MIYDNYTGEKQGYLKKKKLQVDSDVYQDRWFVISNGVLSYYRDRKVRTGQGTYRARYVQGKERKTLGVL